MWETASSQSGEPSLLRTRESPPTIQTSRSSGRNRTAQDNEIASRTPVADALGYRRPFGPRQPRHHKASSNSTGRACSRSGQIVTPVSCPGRGAAQARMPESRQGRSQETKVRSTERGGRGETNEVKGSKMYGRGRSREEGNM